MTLQNSVYAPDQLINCTKWTTHIVKKPYEGDSGIHFYVYCCQEWYLEILKFNYSAVEVCTLQPPTSRFIYILAALIWYDMIRYAMLYYDMIFYLRSINPQ
jgi:hypothetical protein